MDDLHVELAKLYLTDSRPQPIQALRTYKGERVLDSYTYEGKWTGIKENSYDHKVIMEMYSLGFTYSDIAQILEYPQRPVRTIIYRNLYGRKCKSKTT